MATGDSLANLGISTVNGVFDATGAASQAAIQSSVNVGLTQIVNDYNAAIRQGLGSFLASGVSDLLNSIGVNTQNIPYVGGILQNIAQAGLTSAATVFEHVIDGNLTLSNLPFFGDYNTNSILSNDPGITGSIANGVNGLHNTLSSFANNAIGPGAGGLISPIVSKALGGAAVDPSKGSSIVSDTSYAAALADTWQPKYKFLYIVEIQFQSEYKFDQSFTFLIKKFERPKITIEHDEINYYSFRTMVPKRTVYAPFNIEIIDDIQSLSMNFLVSYLRRISPIFNEHESNNYATHSMDYSMLTSSYALQSKNGDAINIIKDIKVHHLYNVNQTMDTYIFHNPKILEATLGDFDMGDGGDGSSISLNLAYDGLEILAGLDAEITPNRNGLLELKACSAPSSRETTESMPDSTLQNFIVSRGISPTNIPPVTSSAPIAPNPNALNTVIPTTQQTSPMILKTLPFVTPTADIAELNDVIGATPLGNLNDNATFLNNQKALSVTLPPIASNLNLEPQQTSPFLPYGNPIAQPNGLTPSAYTAPLNMQTTPLANPDYQVNEWVNDLITPQ